MSAQPPEGVTLIDHPLIAEKLTRLRDAATGLQVFRQLLREIAALMSYEITRDLATAPASIETPLAPHEGVRLARPLVIVPILRAGLGFADGMLTVLSDARLGHIGLSRDEATLRPERYFFKHPPGLADADVLVVDPMLATGWSATEAIAQLKEAGAGRLRFVCLVTCDAGLAQLRAAHPDVPIFTAAIDPELDPRGYIIPGLGDAGDRYFGT